MRTGGTDAAVWREDAAIWEIVAGELVAQRYEPVAEAGSEALVRRAGIMAMRAGEVIRTGDLDAAGHALIGCSVTLGLAALEHREHGHEHRGVRLRAGGDRLLGRRAAVREARW